VTLDEKLLQPDSGHPHWIELALCVGDDRFTDSEPDRPTRIALSKKCLACEVRVECRKFHDEYGAVAVFAAGEWREEEPYV